MNLYQFPGGGCEAKESLKDAARREFEEETGHKLTSLTKIGEFFIDNRRSNMKIVVFKGRTNGTSSDLMGD